MGELRDGGRGGSRVVEDDQGGFELQRREYGGKNDEKVYRYLLKD